MIYSVWNQGLGAYDYFESPGEQANLNVEKPRHLVSRTLGATADQAAWPLPGNLRPIGSGTEAVGRVASRGGKALSGDLGDNAPLVKAAVLVVAGLLLWQYVAKYPKRRRA